MPKPWVLTRQAEAALKDIAVWTVETFGRRQADAYAEDLIEKCQALADGTAPSKDAAVWLIRPCTRTCAMPGLASIMWSSLPALAG